MRFDHIGIAVYQLQPAISRYTEELGFELTLIEEVTQEKIRIAKLRNGEVRIELMEPIHGHSPISRFLEQRGEGIHHIGVNVDDYSSYIQLVANGPISYIEPKIRIGANHKKVTFLHPKALHGVLLEICED